MNPIALAVFAAHSLLNSVSNPADLAQGVGLSPSVLAVAGCPPQAAGAVLTALRGASVQVAVLESSRASLDEAISGLSELQAQIEARGDLEVIEQRAALEASLPGLRANFAAARANLVEAALASVGDEVAARVRRVLVNQSAPLPLVIQVLPLSTAERESIAVALISVAAADREGQARRDSASDARARVHEYTGRSEVIAAESALSGNREAIRQVFESWTE